MRICPKIKRAKSVFFIAFFEDLFRDASLRDERQQTWEGSVCVNTEKVRLYDAFWLAFVTVLW
jgi:hypothetical protein